MVNEGDGISRGDGVRREAESNGGKLRMWREARRMSEYVAINMATWREDNWRPPPAPAARAQP